MGFNATRRKTWKQVRREVRPRKPSKASIVQKTAGGKQKAAAVCGHLRVHSNAISSDYNRYFKLR
jgi:hypothetical protein